MWIKGTIVIRKTQLKFFVNKSVKPYGYDEAYIKGLLRNLKIFFYSGILSCSPQTYNKINIK